jgi:cysteine desulfurase
LLYFDHNATTFVAPEVADVMDAAVRELYGNPSSTHSAGQAARDRLEQARRTVAGFVGASAAEIAFTSGGTETNNLAIYGIAKSAGHNRHIVTTTIEHPSVLECCRHLQREGVAVTFVPVNRSGVVDLEAVDASIRDETVLISVMHANNETGAVQPIAEIARLVKQRRALGQEIYLHSDGVQAIGKIDIDVHALGVDLYSMSAHKVFAPKGAGALFVRRSVPLRGIQHGGRHERERRAGTENVPGIVAFARALELCGSTQHLAELRDYFERHLLERMPDLDIHARGCYRLPNTSNVLFNGLSAEALVIALDMRDIAVSTGSACSSGSIEPSHVLLAMGLTRDEAKSSVRFSFGRYNTLAQVDQLIDAVCACVSRLRPVRPVEPQFVN